MTSLLCQVQGDHGHVDRFRPPSVSAVGRSLRKRSALAVTFDPPFQSVPAVTTTLHAASAGDQLVLTDETATGFSIQVVNDGVGVARSFNWMAQGYGHVEDQES